MRKDFLIELNMKKWNVGAFCLITTTLVVALTLSSKAADAAEGQTVEGAQKFLSMVLPGKIYWSPGVKGILREQESYVRNNGYYVARNGEIVPDRHGWFDYKGDATVVTAKPSGNCGFFIIPDYSKVMVGWNADVKGVRNYSQLTDTQLGRDVSNVLSAESKEFNWGKVQKVEQKVESVYIKFPNQTESATINLGSESMAKRVAYAMEFLRVNCDESAATGF